MEGNKKTIITIEIKINFIEELSGVMEKIQETRKNYPDTEFYIRIVMN